MAKPRGPHKNEESRKAFLENLGRRVAACRQARQLSQRELASSAGISQDAVSRFELGSRTPTVGTLFDLAQALGLDVSSLVDFSADDESCSPIESLLKDQPDFVRQEAVACVSSLVRVSNSARRPGPA